VLTDGGFESAALHTRVEEALTDDLIAVGIDMPIGLPPPWPRAADATAKQLLGPRGASRVFLTFPRAVYEAPTFAEALVRARETTGAGISQQSFALGRKILEVDELARLDARMIEVHPELSFSALRASNSLLQSPGDGRALPSKRSWNGLMERVTLLQAVGIDVPPRLEAGSVATDDVADAAVAAWSAERYARGEAKSLPDGHRERIGAIWY
jgi:predicted RNase H-like nuclease